jgi:hypothetical protein
MHRFLDQFERATAEAEQIEAVGLSEQDAPADA